MTVVTRFAPSPTGFLHIGGARTALFNWLYARHCNGKFLLRVEDTDRKRSTPEAVDAIFAGLHWLGLDWDEEPVFQAARAPRHAEVAQQLLAAGQAYHCYCTQEELEEMRATARAEGRPMRYDGRWRDRDPAEAPKGVPPVVRLKAPRDGETVIEDLVQGTVRFANEQLDDMILLRADGTPTYMLSVVVDDHDMGITHIVRGDDHLTNAARQRLIYDALGWTAPAFAHIPLIHGPDGAKLSKRHGALGVEAYRDMGYLPEAMRNYLLRLGWGHGDEEVIATEQAIQWFDLDAVGRSPARIDFAKLENLNGIYLRAADDNAIRRQAAPFIETMLGRPATETEMARFGSLIPSLKERAKTLIELVDNAKFLFLERPLVLDEKAAKLLTDEARSVMMNLRPVLSDLSEWTPDSTEAAIREFADGQSLKLGKVAQPLRAALCGRTTSPGIFEVLGALGREESLARISDVSR